MSFKNAKPTPGHRFKAGTQHAPQRSSANDRATICHDANRQYFMLLAASNGLHLCLRRIGNKQWRYGLHGYRNLAGPMFFAMKAMPTGRFAVRERAVERARRCGHEVVRIEKGAVWCCRR